MTWNIAGRQVLITGGNAGIGKATAEELARRGANVTITVREAEKGRKAAADIKAATGVEIEVGLLDLSWLESVRSFADWFVDRHPRLHVLVNNAGLMTGKRRETPDGFEWTLGVNHLGPFLLTNLLTDLLVGSAPARVINVSSQNHQTARNGLDFTDLQMTTGYSSSKAYAASKLANVLFTVELDRRLRDSGVVARALHPGVVATSFGKSAESSRMIRWGMTVIKPILKKPSQGAATSVLLASAPESEIQGGLYWSDEQPKLPTDAALDPEQARRLWVESERLVGLSS